MSTNTEPVACASHKNIRVVQSYTFAHVKDSQFMPLNASEFGYASTCYPIFFLKDKSTAKFFAVALFGIDEGENLFYSPEQWQASYVPKLVRIAPFSIGSVEVAKDGKKWVVCIDRDSDYLSTEQGELLFDEGEETPYLIRAREVLAELYQDKMASIAFIDRLLSLNLIKPVQFNLSYEGGDRRLIDGLYSIKGDGLAELDSAHVQEFHKKGYFQAAFAILNSQHNLYDLMRMKQARGGEKITTLHVVDRKKE